MDRREAVKNVALLMGAAISATTLSMLTESCNTPVNKSGARFSPEQEATIAELAETIIPTTSTPGAKAAGVGPFITMMINECYPADVQKMFVAGVEDLDKRSDKKFSGSFAEITPANRKVVLQEVVDELKKKKTEKQAPARARTGNSVKKDLNFFQLAKELTMLGYFTSEIGAKQALVYLQVPGRYDGCTTMTPGQKSWAL